MPDENAGATDVAQDTSAATAPDTSSADSSSQALEPSDGGSSGAAGERGGWLDQWNPSVAPSEKFWRERGYNEIKAMHGRVAAMQRAQAQAGQVSPDVQGDVDLAKEIMEIPGIYEIALSLLQGDRAGVDRWYQQMSGGRGGQQSQTNGTMQQAQQALAFTFRENPQEFAQKLNQYTQQVINGTLAQYHRQYIEPLSRNTGSMQQQAALAQLRASYPDLSRYESAVRQLMSQGLSPQRAYFVAKGEAGGFARPQRPPPKTMFSEGAGPRGEGDAVTEDEKFWQQIKNAGGGSTSPL